MVHYSDEYVRGRIDDMDTAIEDLSYYDKESLNFSTLQNVTNPAAYHAFLEIAEALDLEVTGTLKIERPKTREELEALAIIHKRYELQRADREESGK
jgi:hypothetical protein